MGVAGTAIMVVALHMLAQTPGIAPTAGTAPAPPTLPAVEGDLTPEQRFKRGKNLFDYGDCAQTLSTLASLAVPGQLKDEKSQLEVHRMLGVCYVFASKELEAAREFSSLLSIDPDFTLDPFLTPPAAIEVYERQKTAMKEQLEEIRHARDNVKANGLDDSGGVLLERTTVVRDVPLAAAFLPFGFAQAANGETVKAIILGSVQGACLVTNVTFFWASIGYLADTTEGTPQEQQAKESTYQAMLYTSYIAAMGVALSYAYGVGDALWNRADNEIVDKKQTRRALTPEEIRQLQKVQPAP